MYAIGHKYTWGTGRFEYEVRAIGDDAIGVYCFQTGKYLSASVALRHLLSKDALKDFRYVEETVDAAKRDRPFSPY